MKKKKLIENDVDLEKVIILNEDDQSLFELYKNAYPFSVEQLSQKIEQVVYGDQIRNNLINLGLKQSKKFSWEKCAEETLTIYNKII